jgi:protoheme IX farnesyltransferase
VAAKNAWIFAAVLALVSMLLLAILVNLLTAALTFASLIGYAFIYTGYLKRATPQNIVIGGVSGAAPPLLGWAAISNSVDPQALLLVLIIFTWTPPHFWALAIHRRDDYAKADIPMLPVIFGVPFTKTCVLLYTVLLLLTTLLPYLTHGAGVIYLIGSTILGLWFMWHAWMLKFRDDGTRAMATFRFSIVYLMALFVVLLADHYLA